MGSVLAFEPREAATIRRQPVAGETASIVIFPGVRYERWHEETVEQEDARNGKAPPKH